MAEPCLIDISMCQHGTTITHPPSLPLPDHDSLFFVDCQAFLDPLSPRLVVKLSASSHPPAYSVISHPGLAVIAQRDGPDPALLHNSIWVDIPRYGRVVISFDLLRIACRMSVDRGCKQLWIDVLCMYQEWHAKNAEAQEHYSLRRHNIYWDAQLCLIFPSGLRHLSRINEMTQYCRNDHFLVETRLTHPHPMRPVVVVLRWDPEALGIESSSSESWTLVVNSIGMTDDVVCYEHTQDEDPASPHNYIPLAFDVLLRGSTQGISLRPGEPLRHNQRSYRLKPRVFGDVEQAPHRELIESLWQVYSTHSKQKAIECAFKKALVFGYSSISHFAVDVYAAIIGVDSPSEPLPSRYAPTQAASFKTIVHLLRALHPLEPCLDSFRAVAGSRPYPRYMWPRCLQSMPWANARKYLAGDLPLTPVGSTMWSFDAQSWHKTDSHGADTSSHCLPPTSGGSDLQPAAASDTSLDVFGKWVLISLDSSIPPHAVRKGGAPRDHC
ncbi:hypothetical protein OH76DRAFT_1474529 [Lentinus brumalis]|uniref:Heterokaryon incompatibility domain-containing protein n=1 Tax=Lentinus brumalis TaxID=2498619 RepID=A0A371CV09_9APHY|nr:hypothetical protein OH76DRAFT_1474529 [Polyporus brumalis]